ncbi:hypothetical protein IFM89_015539 [Coptis chinensis]|uniref:Uncharacterized protein n=1 Tax=Coptis chinensis TaxID=261450 RepID=A0A835M002_9MAGN|nr:hypothetical protein IFM89_015539 [Coptis chinensis]
MGLTPTGPSPRGEPMDMGFGAIVMNCKKLGKVSIIWRHRRGNRLMCFGDALNCRSLRLEIALLGMQNRHGNLARGMFLLVQVVLLLDFVHGWNDSWVKKDEQFWLVEFLYPSDYVGYLEKGKFHPRWWSDAPKRCDNLVASMACEICGILL